MADNSSSSSGGIGFVGLLTIVFITLKLIGKIDWPWIWVLSPIWISIGIVLTVLVVVGAVLLIAAIVHNIIEARRKKAVRERLKKQFRGAV